MAVLGSTSLTGCNSIPDFIAAGSLMLFQQTSAPTGWTKQTTHNDKALRVVTGSVAPGGTFTFSAVFTDRTPTGTVGNTTLSTPQIPSHNHTGGASFPGAIGFPVQTFPEAGSPNPSGFYPGYTAPNAKFSAPASTGSTGGGGAHSHPFTGSSLSFSVQYVDLIICSKNA